MSISRLASRATSAVPAPCRWAEVCDLSGGSQVRYQQCGDCTAQTNLKSYGVSRPNLTARPRSFYRLQNNAKKAVIAGGASRLRGAYALPGYFDFREKANSSKDEDAKLWAYSGPPRIAIGCQAAEGIGNEGFRSDLSSFVWR